mmetsp:Transcript_86164/g.136012  ORF Transcript_86164/g.136012 Transcript_86164/m.136012 type:complete len:134 (+) Transcript_86164:77-478(+)
MPTDKRVPSLLVLDAACSRSSFPLHESLAAKFTAWSTSTVKALAIFAAQLHRVHASYYFAALLLATIGAIVSVCAAFVVDNDATSAVYSTETLADSSVDSTTLSMCGKWCALGITIGLMKFWEPWHFVLLHGF